MFQGRPQVLALLTFNSWRKDCPSNRGLTEGFPWRQLVYKGLSWAKSRLFQGPGPWSWHCSCPGYKINLWFILNFSEIPSVVVQLLSHVRLFVTPWTAARQASLSFTISRCLLKLMSIELVIPSNHLVLYHSLLLLPSIFPSIRVFSNESALRIRWPKYWSFSFSISPSNGYSGLISFRIDWFDLLAVQGTLKRLLQHNSSKHQFFCPQLSL